MTIHENYPLKNLHTFGIDVKAKHFFEVFEEYEFVNFLKDDNRFKNNLLLIGEGSNILFTKDYDGTVLKYSKKGIEIIEETNDDVLIKADAGEIWDDLVKFCVENNFYGIENTALIPGCVGAAPIQNIGAYGVELKDVFEYLEGFSVDNCNRKIINKEECNFGYRNSIFKKELNRKFIITKVVLRLNKNKKLNLTYRALKDVFNGINHDDITIQQVREAVKQIRTSKLPDTKIYGNAGSFFKNPEIDSKHLNLLEEKYPDIVYHKISDESFKIPAGWLIEKCGFKGKREGNVGCFEKQSLVIINYGDASGIEIRKFSEKIVDEVYIKFLIKLETEVNIL